jgi:hypothetical protein
LNSCKRLAAEIRLYELKIERAQTRMHEGAQRVAQIEASIIALGCEVKDQEQVDCKAA